MVSSISACVLIVAGLLAVALQRFYSSVPSKELKRLASRGDHLAKALYRPVAYGASLRLLLWTVAVISLPLGCTLLAGQVPKPALLGALIALGAVLIWLGSAQLTVHRARLAVWAAPPVEKILSYLHPVLQKITGLAGRYYAPVPHSGLYEKEDLADLLTQQKEQPDNRLAQAELDILVRALHFGDKTAADITRPRAKMRLLSTQESIGPILLDELHQTEQSSFLVYEDKPEHVVGVLRMKDAARAKEGGRVLDLMQHRLCYVNEDFSLPQVARAFMETGEHTVVVVNKFAEFVGVITLSGLLHELFGELKPNAGVSYEYATSVAEYMPPQPQPEESAPEATPVSSAETADASAELA